MSSNINRHKLIRSILPREIDKANMVQTMKDSWATWESMKNEMHDKK